MLVGMFLLLNPIQRSDTGGWINLERNRTIIKISMAQCDHLRLHVLHLTPFVKVCSTKMEMIRLIRFRVCHLFVHQSLLRTNSTTSTTKVTLLSCRNHHQAVSWIQHLNLSPKIVLGWKSIPTRPIPPNPRNSKGLMIFKALWKPLRFPLKKAGNNPSSRRNVAAPKRIVEDEQHEAVSGIVRGSVGLLRNNPSCFGCWCLENAHHSPPRDPITLLEW